MSGGKTVKTTENNTAQVKLPEWMTGAGASNYAGAAKFVADNPVTAYGGPLSAGMTGNQSQASAVAAGGANAGQGDLNAARWLTGGAATGGQGRVNAGKFDAAAAAEYRNPFAQEVQGRTIMDMLRQNRMQMAGLDDSLAGSKAFGGTRHAVATAEAATGQNRNMLDYLASSNAAAYEDAASKFNTDRAARMQAETTNAGLRGQELDRMMQGGAQFAGLGNQDANMRSQSIRDLLLTGGVEQDTAQRGIDAQYADYLRTQNEPLNRYAQLQAILSGTPRDVTTTSTGNSTQKQKGSWIDTALGLAQIGASAFSERRVKRDIDLIGTLANGLGVYRFSYMWDRATRHVGVMVDEVARLAPHALGPRFFGIRTVNYSALEAA